MPIDLAGLLRRLLSDSHIYFALKVLLAILGLLAFALATGDIQLTVLLSLGVVAGAIAETDDSLNPVLINHLGAHRLFLVAKQHTMRP